MNWIGDEDGDSADEDGGSVSADGGDDLFGDLEDGGKEFGDMDDDFEEDFDDDFGDMGGTDDFGGDANVGGGGQMYQDLENRVESLENEVSEISSTINTVRSENEEISETVGEVEENVRKLLEIYEMVTRGVNPFVDEVQGSGEMDGSAFGGDFGLFEDEGEEGDDEEESVDEDVMDADPESFFDEDLDEEEVEDEEVEDEPGGATPEEEVATGAGGDAEPDASSFEELKAEYEAGEADWADDEGAGGADETDVAPGDEFEFDEPVADPDTSGGGSARADGKPYLDTVPGGYVVDLVVMEWLEFLIEEFGPEQAARTIEYYERIEWISESASERLLAFLEGIADVEPGDSEELGPVELDIDDHIRSLTFISQLSGDSMDRKIVDHCAQIRGDGRGLQR